MSFLMPDGWGCEVAKVSIRGRGEGLSGKMMSLTSADKAQEMRIDMSSLLSTRGSKRDSPGSPLKAQLSYLVCLGHR